MKLDEKIVVNALKKNSVKAQKMLSYLGKAEQFLNAINTPVGEELLRDILEMTEDRLNKIIDESATEQEKSEYRVLRQLSSRWIDRINDFHKVKNELIKDGQVEK